MNPFKAIAYAHGYYLGLTHVSKKKRTQHNLEPFKGVNVVSGTYLPKNNYTTMRKNLNLGVDVIKRLS